MITRLIALAAGTLASEDLTCIAAGLLVAQHALGPLSATAACALGIYAGDLALWIAGRTLASRALKWRRVRAVLPSPSVEDFRVWFDNHARNSIIGSRFVPGTRLPLYIAAGAASTSFRRFAAWSLVAVSVWTPLLVALAAVLGEALSRRIAGGLAFGRILVLIVAATALLAWRLALRLSSCRARQKAAAMAARIWRWEFWPMWLFYAPVALWTLYLAIRHRGYGVVATANPGMPDGGIVGESKFDILSRLPPDATIPSAALESGPLTWRVASLARTIQRQGWSFPIILKPDVGQRGSGVRLISTIDEAAAYLSEVGGRVLVQPYHKGPFEAGIFYYRRPEWARGRILAITDKHFPEVIGDGVSSIEDLVWSHQRYRMQARTFFARLGERRLCVPAPGEPVRLALAGNHAQGTMFKDGRALITPALEARIDAIAKHYDGFFIGRFDVRYGDRAEFMAGTDVAIVELNGATAECTNIYDPEGSLWSAYRQLFRQWSLVFAIGAANRRRGEIGASMERLITIVCDHVTASSPFPVSD